MRALALFSGGLDSMLAIKALSDQGIEVIALYIKIGFGSKKDVAQVLEKRAKIAGAKLVIIDTREEYIQNILFAPKYGYGKNFNPCIDCHGFMFRVAKALMSQYNASFIVTGEVLGQRPMSQRSDALYLVSKLAHDTDEKLILRPLSAKLMQATTPELEGWVDREKLLDISGRGRERQIALAKAYGWEEYESPGGGCLLTDPAYAQKLKEHIEHSSFEIEDIELLKFGRHFRLPDGAKLIVGREEADNESLKGIQTTRFIGFTSPIIGPFSLLSKDASFTDKMLAAKIVITYSKSTQEELYEVVIGEESLCVTPFENKSMVQEFFVIR